MAILDSLTAFLRYSQVLPYIKELERRYGCMKILDAGGGDGSFHEILRKRGHQVVVVDISKGDVKADLNVSLPFKDNSFDVVVSLAVVEHLENWKLALKEFGRVGRFVILTTPTPAAEPVLELLAKLRLVNREHIKDHKHYLSKMDLRKAGYQTRVFLFGLNRLGLHGLELKDELSPWFYLLIVAVLVVLFPKLPPDDLLRHLSAYRYDYDYSKMFMFSYVPSFDFYYPFDLVAGTVHRLLGDYAYIPFQILAVFLYGLATVLLLEETRNNLKTLIVGFVLYLLVDRILLGRPTVIASGLFLIAYALRDRNQKWHLPIVFLLPFVYYLFFIYLIPLLFFRNVRKVYLLSMVLGFVFWLSLGGLEYFSLLYHIFTAKSHRLMEVAEGQSFAYIILSSLVLASVPLMFFWRKDKVTMLTSLYFALSNQIRYVETIVPLWMSFFRFIDKKVNVSWKVSVPLMLFFLSPYAVVSQTEVVVFDHSVRVAFSNMPEMYRSVYFSKAEIRVIPSMEIGWVREDVQMFLKELSEGKLDCSKVQELGLEYVVEDTLVGALPSCVELDRVEVSLRVLRVKH